MMEVPTERGDPRLEYLGEYVCKTLRLKPEKWSRMLVSDEQRTFLNSFIDRDFPQVSLFLSDLLRNLYFLVGCVSLYL